MGRHTAPITIISVVDGRATGPVTDPHLLDQPLRIASAPSRRRATRPPQAAPTRQKEEQDGLDEIAVDVVPRSVRSVLDAEDAATSEDDSPSRIPRLRDLLFVAASLAVIGTAVASGLIR